MSDVDEGDMVKRLPCLHMFHAGVLVVSVFVRCATEACDHNVLQTASTVGSK